MRSSHLASALSPLLAAGLAACGVGDEAPCVDDATFFRAQLYPQVVQETCMSCHTADGLARASDLVFVSPARPDHAEVNQAVLDDVAGLERDGTSIVLIKSLGDDAHGGGAVLARDSEAWQLLQQYVERLEQPSACEALGDRSNDDAGLTLLSPVETLRKSAILLVGRLPTAAEAEQVRTGGEAGLVRALWQMMAEPTFVEVFKERMNDVLLTDRYLDGDDGIGIFDDDRFPGVYAYEQLEEGGDTMRRRTSRAIAREPIELAAWLVQHDRPWTELLTADYTVVNQYSAVAYGVAEGGLPELQDADALAFFQARVPDFPHAGLLTTPAFLNRYPTTATNRNRHRAWFFFKTFLATDILTFADRPIDPTVSSAHNPTLNDPQCTVCHATMDPVAGTFQAWDDEGRLRPRDEGWYAEMAAPGFGERELPSADEAHALRWLAEQAVADPRYGIAAVRTMLRAYTGLELYTPHTAGEDEAKLAALAAQDAWIEAVAAELAARGWDIKYAVEQVILSRYFRAEADAGASAGALLHAGTAHLLTPEELDRKILAVTGFPWKSGGSSRTHLSNRYAMLYGGIDSASVTTRLRDPNGIIASIGLRMAHEMACEAVPHDLVLTREQRRLLPFVEASFEPLTDDGFVVPEAEQAIRRNIQWLHLRMLGEDLDLSDPEITATYDLWYDVWQAGKQAVASGELASRLPDGCTATSDPFTGDGLPDERRIQHDPDHTLRAWIAVASYLLADWRFLHE